MSRFVALAGVAGMYAAGAWLPMAAGGEAQVKSTTWNFDTDKPGAPPQGFTAPTGEWKVVADESPAGKGNVVAQLARNAKAVYNVTLVSSVKPKDVDVTVKFRAVSGDIDQGGGLVWRARDAENYYIARYNPLEENFRVYKVEGGKRTQLETADVKKSDGWHTLRVTMIGDQITCYYDGQKYLESKDATFAEAGMIGLWTKADAQTHFDELVLSGG
ncbi:MAG: hypothetical protein HY763_11440 [Planctomycetes bacterium]|nr:hypothetical protein [Planctomycetota bacterium]